MKVVHEAVKAQHAIPIRMPKPTLPLQSYRGILEGDWDVGMYLNGQNNTRQKSDKSPLHVSADFVFDPFRPDSPLMANVSAGHLEHAVAHLSLRDDSPLGWPPAAHLLTQPAPRTERLWAHNSSSSQSSQSSLDPSQSSHDSSPTLPLSMKCEVAQIDDDDNDLENPVNVARILRWSDEMLQWDPTTEPMPLMPKASSSQLQDIGLVKERPLHLKREKFDWSSSFTLPAGLESSSEWRV
ncbi:hypothetical protein B0H21DRAFT_729012 [Amylocystis lapponica]|nr:hypothetical protein B0H21DRAFT_729012 [Amylocystis lapponica]